MGIIYKWTCNKTGKSYIGRTSNPIGRKKQHIKNGSKVTNINNKLYTAMRKYNDWTYTILERNIPNNQLDKYECYYIGLYDSYKNGYNSTIGGSGQHYIRNYKNKIYTENITLRNNIND